MLKAGMLVFLLPAIQVHSQAADPVTLLLKLVSRADQKPMVVYMDTGKKNPNYIDFLVDDGLEKVDGKSNAFEDVLTGDDGVMDDDITLEEVARDQAKILLYSFIRTTPDENPHIEETKQVLRQALRFRCKKVTTCTKKCKVKKQSCHKSCQEALDDMNLCEPPKNKHGKTMPPYW